jgi:RNA polymerase sigma-70 factor (ECF subfamily)
MEGPRGEDPPHEEDLPRLLASDPRRYFPSLVEIYGKRLSAYSLKLAGNQEDADDVVQDTFTNAFVALGHLSAEQVERLHLRPWLRRIARNSFVNMLRRQKLQTVALDTPGVKSLIDALEDTLFEQPETALEMRELSQKVRKFLKSVPPKYRIPVIWRYGLQLSYPEIADVLNVPVKKAKGYVSFGLKKLRNAAPDQECF